MPSRVVHRGGNPVTILLTIIRKRLAAATDHQATVVAQRLAQEVRSAIYSQSLPLDPLNPDYERRKRALGRDPRTLISTGAYVGSIQARRQWDGSWEVGPDDDLIPGQSITFRQLGAFLEFGTRTATGAIRMPARPHWRPVVRDFLARKQRHAEEFRDEVWDMLVPELKVEMEQLKRTQRTYKGKPGRRR